MREIKKIIIHCSDTEDGTFESIRDFHINVRGWSDIGYHSLITRDGVIHPGRKLETIGAHCEGENHDSLGGCMIGIKTFTMAQVRSMIELCKIWCLQFGLTPDDIYGHYEFQSAKKQGKTCPNFLSETFRAIIQSRINT